MGEKQGRGNHLIQVVSVSFDLWNGRSQINTSNNLKEWFKDDVNWCSKIQRKRHIGKLCNTFVSNTRKDFCEHTVLLIKSDSLSRFSHVGKSCLNFSSSRFVIRVSLLHPKPSLFLYGLLLSLWCFSVLINYYFPVSFNFSNRDCSQIGARHSPLAIASHCMQLPAEFIFVFQYKSSNARSPIRRRSVMFEGLFLILLTSPFQRGSYPLKRILVKPTC